MNIFARPCSGIVRAIRCFRHSSSLMQAFCGTTKMLVETPSSSKTGLYGVPDLVSPDGFKVLGDRVEVECAKLVQEACDPDYAKQTKTIVQIMDALSNTLCSVADLAECVRLTHPDRTFANAAEECVASLQHLVERLNTNTELYESVVHRMQKESLSDVDRRVGDLLRLEFEASGVHLPNEQRKKFVDITQDIFHCGSEFVRGTEEQSVVPEEVIPKELLSQFSRLKNRHLVVLNSPLSGSHNTTIRELGYKLYYAASKSQEELLLRLLQARQELASLTGFQSFAHRSLKGTLVETPETAVKFVDTLGSELQRRLPSSLEELRKVKAQQGVSNQEVMPWDLVLLSSIAKSARFNVSEDVLKPYFSLGTVLTGLSELLSSLCGVTLDHVDHCSGEVWSPDVRKLAVRHPSEGILGYVYCDFYQRPSKFGETHFTIYGGRVVSDGLTESYQTPVVTLSLSFAPAAHDSQCALHMYQVDNLFHEVGHAMHSVLGRTKYQHTTGTRCPTDFAEIPSNLMEYFAFDPRVMALYAKNSSAEPLPHDIRQRVAQSRNHLMCLELLQQCCYASFDLALHGGSIPASTVSAFDDFQRKFGLPSVSGTAWHHRFAHLGPYGSKYYAYLVARAVASLIWQRCFAKDPFSRESGDKYRHLFLAYGGEMPPMDLVQNLLGYRPEMGHLVEALVKEVDESLSL